MKRKKFFLLPNFFDDSPAHLRQVSDEFESADEAFTVKVEPIAAPDGRSQQSYARCTCGWGQVFLFGPHAATAARNHLAAAHPADQDSAD